MRCRRDWAETIAGHSYARILTSETIGPALWNDSAIIPVVIVENRKPCLHGMGSVQRQELLYGSPGISRRTWIHENLSQWATIQATGIHQMH
jgi:hypothetical protein